MPSGHAYAKAVRTVKTCVGTDFCRFGLGDAIGVGIELERAMEGLLHAAQGQVGGRPAARATAPRPTSRTSGWSRSRAAGSSTSAARPARPSARATCSRRSTRPTRRSASRSPSCSTTASRREYLERTYGYVERVGLEAVRAAVLDPSAQADAARALSRSPRPPPTRTRGASATTPSTRKQFAELDSEPALTARRRRGRDDRAAVRPGWTRVGASTTSRCSRAAASRSTAAAIAIFRLPDGFAAIDAACPHARRPAAGRASSPTRCVTCPLHGRRFDLRTGERSTGGEDASRSTRSSSTTASCWVRPGGVRVTREVRTGCPYCGIGCGLVAEVARRAADRGQGRPAAPGQPRRDLPQAAAAARGACTRPTARRRRCGAAALDERWRARTWRQAVGELAARLRDDQRRARPGRDRVLHLRPAADRGLLRGQQARQGLPRHQQRRLQLAPVHVQRGRGLHAARSAPTGRRRPTPTSTQADCLLLLGSNTAACHPIVWSRIRRRQAQGASVIVVDPRRDADRRGAPTCTCRSARAPTCRC